MRDNIDHQYRTIAAGAGWIRRDSLGFLRFEGADALSFLHALLTADVAGLALCRGAHALYLTPQGRMIADLEVYRRPGQVLASVGEGMAAALAARFDGLIFAEDVRVADVSAEYASLDVIGRSAATLVADACGIDAGGLDSLVELAQVDLAAGFIVRRGDAPLPTFRVCVPPADREAIIQRMQGAGGIEMGSELATALRIEAGRAVWHADLAEDTIPLEAGLLDRAISTTKGCYVGQEVIIRILHRGGGRVARRLVVLALPADSHVPAPGTPIAAGDQQIGRVTSAAFSPMRGRVVALAYVARDVAEPGAMVAVGAGGPLAEIVGLAR